MAMMLSEHPIAAAVMLTLAGVAGFAVLVDRERARREACAARAEHAYHTDLSPTLEPVLVHYDRGTRSATVQPHTPRNPAAWHLIGQLPTQPLGGIR